MALVIGTNIASLNAQRHLSSAQDKAAVAMERLSTGLRINTGQDDGAGLAIGSTLGAKVRGLNQAVRNANDGVSMAKTADAALSEVGNMLERMRELATENVNGALSATDKTNITNELTALNTEIGNIKTNAKFNSVSLLSAAVTASFQVGEAATDVYSFNVTVGAVAPTDTTSVGSIEGAIANVTTARASFGQAATALESRAANSAALAENMTAARGRIMDADIAQETANMTKANVLQQAGIAVLAQANQAPNMVLSLLK
jgi:flagellin